MKFTKPNIDDLIIFYQFVMGLMFFLFVMRRPFQLHSMIIRSIPFAIHSLIFHYFLFPIYPQKKERVLSIRG